MGTFDPPERQTKVTARPVDDATYHKVLVEPCDAGVRITIYEAGATTGTYIDLSQAMARDHIRRVEQVLNT